jgi:hypothetical protein
VSAELERLRHTEIWIAWVRVLAVPFAAFEVAIVGDEHPPGYERWGWATDAALMLGAVAFFWLAHRPVDRRSARRHARRRVRHGAGATFTVRLPLAHA